MNIKEAKEEIRRTVGIYLEKDDKGEYVIPYMKKRPIFLTGAPGIGKTAIVSQVAEEMGIGLVSYSMTHHTRQSMIGLPYITEKSFGKNTCRVTEYTMSEIIASVYDAMEQKGTESGILFLDEINCVSETLTPAILQFLQYKTFGGHSLPESWVIVSAGNPVLYNRSAREFDIATKDRLKIIPVEEDFTVWKEYACGNLIHSAVISFLEIDPGNLFSYRSTEDGPVFATARGWEDLSFAIRLYEKKGFPVGIPLISQYITDMEIAGRFAVYYDLYGKYREAFRTEPVLAGDAGPELMRRAEDASFDERIAWAGLIAEAVTGEALNITKDSDDKTDMTGVRDRLDNSIRFVRKAWGEGQELTYYMTILTSNPHSRDLIAKCGSEAYRENNSSLLIYDEKEELKSLIRRQTEN